MAAVRSYDAGAVSSRSWCGGVMKRRARDPCPDATPRRSGPYSGLLWSGRQRQQRHL